MISSGRDTFRDRGALRSRAQKYLLGLAALVILLFAMLGSRYGFLQLSEHDKYSTLAANNRIHIRSLPPPRGRIYDRSGTLLAENVPSLTLSLVPERVRDMDATLARLRGLVRVGDEDLDAFRQRLQRQRRPFSPVALRRALGQKEMAVLAVNRYHLVGVEIEVGFVRHYPQGELLAPVLGYVARMDAAEMRRASAARYEGIDVIGKLGIERFYEERLLGHLGAENVEVNASGQVLRTLERKPARPGDDLHLHLDLGLQKLLAQQLAGERAAAVALDVHSGGVLAMVSTPSYDPNLLSSGISRREYQRLRDDPGKPFFNRALLGQYPPGSTIKPFFALAALESGAFDAHTKIADPGYFELEERRYNDWKREGHGDYVDMHQALVESCDIYFYHIGQSLGAAALGDTARRFGFGAPPDLDYHLSTGGVVPDEDWKLRARGEFWLTGDSVNMSIGQGYMLATPMQLAQATAIIARHGRHLPPRFVQRIAGQPLAAAPGQLLEIAGEHWNLVKNAMVAVMHSPMGTAAAAGRGASYRMAGKTGTAQVISLESGQEYNSELLDKRQRDHALFVAFAPAHNPAIVLAIVVENGESGSSVAAPMARAAMDYWLDPQRRAPRLGGPL